MNGKGVSELQLPPENRNVTNTENMPAISGRSFRGGLKKMQTQVIGTDKTSGANGLSYDQQLIDEKIALKGLKATSSILRKQRTMPPNENNTPEKK